MLAHDCVGLSLVRSRCSPRIDIGNCGFLFITSSLRNLERHGALSTPTDLFHEKTRLARQRVACIESCSTLEMKSPCSLYEPSSSWLLGLELSRMRNDVLKLPRGMDMKVAMACLVQGLTAHNLVTDLVTDATTGLINANGV